MIDPRCSKKQRIEAKEGEEEDQGPGFMQEANVDILFEIFICIPDCRSAILCSSVCHAWHRLISHPQFIPRFISHHNQHQDRYPPTYTIIFRKGEVAEYESTLNFQPICKLYSDKPMFLHGKSNTNYLDFLSSSMVVRASCDDLLLLTPGARCFSDFYIANPVTKQFYHLPQGLWLREYLVQGYALVRMPESNCHFKVFLIHPPSLDSTSEFPTISHTVSIFCSKLGKWKREKISYPSPEIVFYNPLVNVFMCNGILFWLEYELEVARIISLDFSRFQCKTIDFPEDFWWFQSQDFCGRVREQVGIVGGEVRLIQVVLTNAWVFALKVWKLLDNSSSSWVLVHGKMYLKRPSEESFVDTFVHPTNGDMVFTVWGQNVFLFNLMVGTYEMFDELQEHLKLNTGFVGSTDRVLCFPMVHPAWPTPLPPV